MFSPNATAHISQSTRNPRRRHRTTSDDSLTTNQGNKRRKRSSLAPDTFENPTYSNGNGYAKAHNGTITLKEPSPEPRSQQDAGTETTSLALRSRGSKRGERRVPKREDGVLQARTDHYIVYKEATLPSALRDVLGKEAWHVEFSPGLGWAVALTHTQAIAWPYIPKNSPLEQSKMLSIKLPYSDIQVRPSKDPLPLAVLVHDSGAGELALLFVMPASGKVVYWESLASAAKADGVWQKQQGIHGTLGGLFSGETITDLVEAEPDGFVLTSSVGRVVHLSVRNSQGRPIINSTFLRSTSSSNGGLLGSFKSVFSSSSWRKDIAAVRPAILRGKNTRQCFLVNVQGNFQIWDLVRHANKLLEYEIDSKPSIHEAVVAVHPERNSNRFDFRIVDFTFFPTGLMSSRDAQLKDSHRLLVLCGYTDGKKIFYYLIDMSIHEGSIDVKVVHPITCWSRQPMADSKWPVLKQRVLLPEPGHTAFVVSDSFFIMVSIAQMEESPSSQLQLESNLLSEPFQDILFLNRETDDRLVGCVIEEPEKGSDKATCLLMANTFGLARVMAPPAGEGESKSERRAAACRARIEQGVFFGSSSKNFLDFRVNLNHIDWEEAEIDSATRQVSDSILENNSKHITAMSPSMDFQLKQRATALHDLIKYAGGYKLSQSTRWHLLWSAEKLAAARAIWQTYSKELATNEKGDKLLLPELLDMLSERYKHENRPEFGESDIVRHYLINDIARIELIIPWAQQAVEELYQEGNRRPAQQASLVSQANDLQVSALEAAFDFREANAELYGIGKDVIDDGIYQGDYAPLPEFWTSVSSTVDKVKELADLDREVALNNDHSPMEGEEGIDEDLLTKLATDNPRLVRSCCRVYDERCRFLKSRPDEKSQASGRSLYEVYVKVRKELILKLTELELLDDAFKLAEHYNDMEALADTYAYVEELCAETMGKPGLEEDEEVALSLRMEDNQRRLKRYFKSFGVKWANAIYTRRLRTGELTELLNESENYHRHLTKFLRERPNLAKLGWMDEVSLKSYKLASENLVASNKQEKNMWAKKIELSLGKLSLLAAKEQGQVDENSMIRMSRKTDRRLHIISIQESLYNYTRPLLLTAIDKTAEVDLAMDSFGPHVQDKTCFEGILRQNLEKLVYRQALDAEELIDILTLMTGSDLIVDDEGFASQRFFLALQLLKLTGFESERKDLHCRVIWRRCMLQDDWPSFNRTEKKGDDTVAKETAKTVLFQTLKEGFRSGLLKILPPLSPSEVLSAGTTPTSLRSSARYAHSPDAFLAAISTDFSSEEKALAFAMEKGRLEMWWPGMVEGARVAVGREADALGEQEAVLAEAKRVFEETVGSDSKRPAPLMVADREVYEGLDGEGDVVMG